MGLVQKDDEANKTPRRVPKASTLEVEWDETRPKAGVEVVEADAGDAEVGVEEVVGEVVEVLEEDRKGRARNGARQAELNSPTLVSSLVSHSILKRLLLHYKLENWQIKSATADIVLFGH